MLTYTSAGEPMAHVPLVAHMRNFSGTFDEKINMGYNIVIKYKLLISIYANNIDLKKIK